ncbi:hypothetical protein Xekj_03902 [Xenorhabdus sp. KJ12.1]|nr:hypothetical protein Xekj_03901 [Xenorhabdus sp. KJ12.1]PHM67358.1 hypothetical protein Xekj_03902 [Xenorhabdus sp. KJ12.1]
MPQLQARLPQVVALTVFQGAHLKQQVVVHHELCAGAIRFTQRVDQLQYVVGGDLGRLFQQPMLQRAPFAIFVFLRITAVGQQTFRFVFAVTVGKRTLLLLSKLLCEFR